MHENCKNLYFWHFNFNAGVFKALEQKICAMVLASIGVQINLFSGIGKAGKTYGRIYFVVDLRYQNCSPHIQSIYPA